MKAVIFSLILILSFPFLSLKADDGKKILDKALRIYNEECPVQINFTMSTQNIGDNEVHRQKGKAWMNGEKFKIDIPEATIWFDGTTQWVLVKDTQEVNINNPDNTELTALNPQLLFKLYQNGYDAELIGQTENNGIKVDEVVLTPIDANEDNIGKVRLHIDKAKSRIMQLVINKDDMVNTIVVNDYNLEGVQDEGIYRFQKSEYPDVEIVDLR